MRMNPRSRRGPITSLDVWMSGAYFAVGFAPITALALSLTGWVPLHVGAPFLVLPAVCAGVVLGVWQPSYGRLAGQGFLLGLLAVLLYDCTRIPFIAAGVWSDFIPNIAMQLLDSPDPNWWVGYGWRYAGNGGGMGLAFAVGYGIFRPRLNTWLLGIGYGLAIWSALLLTLYLVPNGEEVLFAVTPLTFTLSLLGHVVYGAALAMGVSLAQLDRAVMVRPVPVTEP